MVRGTGGQLPPDRPAAGGQGPGVDRGRDQDGLAGLRRRCRGIGQPGALRSLRAVRDPLRAVRPDRRASGRRRARQPVQGRPDQRLDHRQLKGACRPTPWKDHMTDALAELTANGVAVWLDDMSRDRIRTGNLADLIRDRHLVGATTNPTIFQRAITGSELYDSQLRDLALRGVDVGEALRAITTMDVRSACDVLRPVFDASDGVDGRISIEVDPRIAHDTAKTIAEARALWWLVDRPNLFVKIPATVEGLPAISQCLAEGISINVTLIFSLLRYDAVMDAFLDGVERRRGRRPSPRR